MFKVNKNTRTTDVVFTPFFTVSIVDFEQVNVSWAVISLITPLVHCTYLTLLSSFLKNLRIAFSVFHYYLATIY